MKIQSNMFNTPLVRNKEKVETNENIKLINGDSLHKLKLLPENSVDAIVTDPPYGLSFMNKKWDYDVPSVDLWREVFRVLKPGGHVLSFGGTRTYHRMAVNIEDAGFEIRDQVMWIYGSGFPKSHNLKDEWQGWGTALKPANEPICLARKPLEKGLTVAENVLKWGTGAINIDASRVDGKPRTTHAAGNVVTCEAESGHMKGKKPHGPTPAPEGRWPANILFDEEAAKALDEQHTTSAIGYRKNPSTQSGSSFQSNNGVGERGYKDSISASRFFYVAKASKRERGEGNSHPTVKPIKLMEYLIKLVTPPNGTVLDPFMGSGSTGIACSNLEFKFIGIELNEEYFEIAEKRILKGE